MMSPGRALCDVAGCDRNAVAIVRHPGTDDDFAMCMRHIDMFGLGGEVEEVL